MAAIAISSFWIHEIRLLGPFSPIHALSIFTLVMLPLAVLHARSHRVTQHRKAMISIFVGALVIAGAFTFLPGRLSFAIMLDILLIVVIGGMGTMYGGVIVGATLFILAQNYLQAVMGTVSTAAGDAGIPLLPHLFHPDRWLLWLGILFILSVYFFPTGIVGKLRGGSG